MATKVKNKPSKHEFKAEIKQLLDILVHSLYTNREIFLRELISNSSDALDKLRFESNKGTAIIDSDLPLEINVTFNEKEKLLTISDTGTGMTQDELIDNIGTIAKSGSADFLKQLQKNKDDASNIIGKFGVGFYSVFMVAEKVVIKTKSYKEEAPAVEWISDGLGSYEIKEYDKKIKRGTQIEIHLNDESKDFAEKFRLEQTINKYSRFISFPIKLDGEQLNKTSALWREPKSNIKKEDYTDFYKAFTYDSNEPLEVIHVSVDAPIQFSSLMFIPKKNMDMFGWNRDDYGLDLYVRRVLIQHKNKDLLPEYLSFVKGIVDSEDLPLNISRETLQEDIIFHKISESVTKQVLSHLKKMADKKPEKYADFWKEHGKIFKMGYNDYANQEKFLELLRFSSSISKTADELISLENYAGRVKKEQKEIYYVLGSSRESIELDPHLEIFKSKGLEVLYLLEPVDEFVLSSVLKYKDYDFKSIDQVDLEKLKQFEDTETSESEKIEKLNDDDELHFSSLLARIKEILGDKIKEVKISERLKGSPACLVNPDTGMSASMQKIMQMMNKDATIPAQNMEINKDHKLVRNLLKVFKKDSKDQYITDVVEQLYETSLLQEGYLTDPHKLVEKINKLLENSSDWYTSVNKL